MPDASKGKCPLCKKALSEEYSPFCSKRCADLDLGKWLDGDYILAGQSPLEGIDEYDGEE